MYLIRNIMQNKWLSKFFLYNLHLNISRLTFKGLIIWKKDTFVAGRFIFNSLHFKLFFIHVLTLHFVLRYGCNVMECFTNSCGLILLIRYNVDKLDTSLWLLEPLPSDWAATKRHLQYGKKVQ